MSENKEITGWVAVDDTGRLYTPVLSRTEEEAKNRLLAGERTLQMFNDEILESEVLAKWRIRFVKLVFIEEGVER